MENIKVASVQFEHKNGDKVYNINKIEEFVQQACKNDVDMIVFPECCITGYWYLRKLSKEDLMALSENMSDSKSVQLIVKMSKKYNITICTGLIENHKDNLYNTYIVVMPDGTVKYHRKLHCFVNEHMSSGNEYTVIDTPFGWKVGILICYDNNIIENTRITALMGADVIIAPHQTGGCRTSDQNIMGIIDSALWENRIKDPISIEKEFKGEKGRGWLLRWLPSRAHDNGVFYGRIITETWKAADDMVIAKLDASLLNDNTGQRWITARRPSLYKSLTKLTGKELDMFTARFSGKGA